MPFFIRKDTDRDVVYQVLRGKTRRFTVLVDRYKNLVFSTLLAKIDRIDDAEDLAQETFLKAFENLDSLHDARKIGPWLRQIGENLARNFLASRSVRQRDLSPVIELPDVEPPDSELERSEINRQLTTAIAQLKPEQREIILLYYFDGVPSLQKVADFLELPLTTVQGRMERARKELRDILDQQLEAFAQEERLEKGFAKKVMGLLPFTLWRMEKPTTPLGLGWKLAMGILFLTGIGWFGEQTGEWVEQILPTQRQVVGKNGFRVRLASMDALPGSENSSSDTPIWSDIPGPRAPLIDARNLVARMGIGFPVFSDSTGAFWDALQVASVSIPATIIFDKEGKLGTAKFGLLTQNEVEELLFLQSPRLRD